MSNIPEKAIPVLVYTGERGLTPPVREIRYYGTGHGGADVLFEYLQLPRLTDELLEGNMGHDGLLTVSYRMGRVIAVLSKYRVQDRDQNLTNWLVRPDLTPVDIDFDTRHTRFIEGADPRDLDFWLAANAGHRTRNPETLENIRRHGAMPHGGFRHFLYMTNYAGRQLPPYYDAEQYMDRYLEGFADEFAVLPEVPYDELREAYAAKIKEIGGNGEPIQIAFK